MEVMSLSRSTNSQVRWGVEEPLSPAVSRSLYIGLRMKPAPGVPAWQSVQTRPSRRRARARVSRLPAVAWSRVAARPQDSRAAWARFDESLCDRRLGGWIELKPHGRTPCCNHLFNGNSGVGGQNELVVVRPGRLGSAPARRLHEKRAGYATGAKKMGVGHSAPKSWTRMSISRVSTRRRERILNFKKPSRFARSVTSSSTPVAMKPKCAGGRFFRAISSRSKTLSASAGVTRSEPVAERRRHSRIREQRTRSKKLSESGACTRCQLCWWARVLGLLCLRKNTFCSSFIPPKAGILSPLAKRIRGRSRGGLRGSLEFACMI